MSHETQTSEGQGPERVTYFTPFGPVESFPAPPSWRWGDESTPLNHMENRTADNEQDIPETRPSGDSVGEVAASQAIEVTEIGLDISGEGLTA